MDQTLVEITCVSGTVSVSARSESTAEHASFKCQRSVRDLRPGMWKLRALFESEEGLVTCTVDLEVPRIERRTEGSASKREPDLKVRIDAVGGWITRNGKATRICQ